MTVGWLAVTVPVTVVAAIGAASKLGVLVKGGAALEALGAVRGSVGENDFLETLNIMVSLLEMPRKDFRSHSAQVARQSALIARRIGVPPRDVANTQIAAYLHDLGKRPDLHFTLPALSLSVELRTEVAVERIEGDAGGRVAAVRLAGGERQRHQRQAGGERGHQDRDQPFRRAAQHGVAHILDRIVFDQVVNVGDHHHAVACGDASQRNETHQRRTCSMEAAETVAQWVEDREVDGDGGDNWRPSIHMPRWASRITLEVVNVRVQRLQEITHEDARCEGFDSLD
jgi:hypothetical protein